MGLNDEVAVLSKIPIFSRIAPAQLKLIAFASRRVTFSKGQDICRQGEAGDCAYVFISGQADVLVETTRGRRKISSVQSHQIVGEAAILADVPRTATVRAAGEVVALRIEKDVLIRIMRDFPDVAVEITRLLAWRLHNTTLQLTAAPADDAGGPEDTPERDR